MTPNDKEDGAAQRNGGDSSKKSEDSPWNSLEVAKLLTSVLTPLVVAIVGFWIQATIAEQNETLKATERLVDRRAAIYNEIRVKLNRIHCFIKDIGTWKEETPLTITAIRRDIHAVMHANRGFWPADTFNLYLAYMDEIAFKTFRGIGEEAAIRTTLFQKHEGIPAWDKAWDKQLTDEVDPGYNDAYRRLIELISRDLMLKVTKANDTLQRPAQGRGR